MNRKFILNIMVMGGLWAVASAQAATPILQFNFNEGSGNNTASSGSSAGNAFGIDSTGATTSLFGSNGSGVSGQAGDYAMNLSASPSFGGDGPGLKVTNSTTLSEINELSSFTLTGWFHLPTLAGGGSSAKLFDFGGSTGGFYSTLNSTGSISLIVDNDWGARVTSATSYTATNQWNFFAVTYDGTLTSNNVHFYVGDTSGSGLTHAGTRTLNKGAVDAVSSTQPLYMGVSPEWQNAGSLDGSMDLFSIYGSKTNGTGALDLATLTQIQAQAIPEPSTYLFCGILLGTALLIRRKNQRSLS